MTGISILETYQITSEGRGGVELAQKLVSGEFAQQDPLSRRLDSLEYTVRSDAIRALVSC